MFKITVGKYNRGVETCYCKVQSEKYFASSFWFRHISPTNEQNISISLNGLRTNHLTTLYVLMGGGGGVVRDYNSLKHRKFAVQFCFFLIRKVKS